MLNTPKYEFLEHPADIKMRAYGRTLTEVFINAALGMMDYIYGKSKIKIMGTECIEVDAENFESMLINWLAKILALSSIKHTAYVSFNIKKLNNHKIIANISYGKAKAYNEIKAVTYHELSLKYVNNVWIATVVYDI